MKTDFGHPPGASNAFVQCHEPFPDYVDALPIVLWRTNRDGSCVRFSRCWTDYTGREAVMPTGGAGFAGVLHPDDSKRVVALFEACLGQRTPFETEFRLRRRDGSYGWFLSQGNPHPLPGGEYDGHVGSMVDISARETGELSLAETEARLRFAIDAAEGAVWDWNPQTGEANFSAKATEMLGYPEHAIDARDVDWFEFIHPLDRHIVDRLAADYGAGRLTEHQREVRMRCAGQLQVDIDPRQGAQFRRGGASDPGARRACRCDRTARDGRAIAEPRSAAAARDERRADGLVHP